MLGLTVGDVDLAGRDLGSRSRIETISWNSSSTTALAS
jgi:hypothetical protein